MDRQSAFIRLSAGMNKDRRINAGQWNIVLGVKGSRATVEELHPTPNKILTLLTFINSVRTVTVPHLVTKKLISNIVLLFIYCC
jgi:hypothetical protein